MILKQINMLRKLLFILLFSVFGLKSYAQLTHVGVGAKSLGMANTTVTISDVWSAHNNVAGLATLEDNSMGVYFQNRFGVSGFNTVAFAGALKTKYGVGGLSLQRFGDALYNEQIIGFGYANKLDFVSLGLKVNLMQVTIQELGTRSVVTFDFGGIVDLTDKLKFGANIFNMNQAKMNDYEDERFSTIMKAGFSYRPFEKLMINIEAEKDPEYKANTKAGLEYWIVDKLAFRTGFSTLYRASHFGLGLKLRTFDIDYSLSYHNQLGVSNHFSVNYNLKKSE